MEILEGNHSIYLQQNISSQDVSNDYDQNNFKEIFTALWIVGISLSYLGLFIQIFILLLVPSCRKFDEITVCQMTIARTLYTSIEYYFSNHVEYDGYWTKVVIFFLYIYTDLVSLVLMFVFTKNLYNKVVIVLPLTEYNLVILTAIVWIIPIPFAILCPLLLNLKNGSFSVFYKVYAYLKFAVCCLNAFIFITIIRASFQNIDKGRNFSNLLKTAAMAFILVTITSLQVLLTDLVSYFYEQIKSNILVSIFCVIYSYQVCVITVIFIVLVKSKILNPIRRMFIVHYKIDSRISTE